MIYRCKYCREPFSRKDVKDAHEKAFHEKKYSQPHSEDKGLLLDRNW